MKQRNKTFLLHYKCNEMRCQEILNKITINGMYKKMKLLFCTKMVDFTKDREYS